MPDALLVDRVQRRLLEGERDFDQAGTVGVGMGSFRDPGEEVGGGHHRDRRTDKAFEVAGDDGIEPGFHGAGDLQVVLEVGTWHGLGEMEGSEHEEDTERVRHPVTIREASASGVAPHDVKDRGYGGR